MTKQSEVEHAAFIEGVALYEEANRRRDAGDYEQAQQLYARALACLNAKLDIFVFYDIALAYDFAGQFEMATKTFQKCVEAFENFKQNYPDDERLRSWENFVDGVREQLILRASSDKKSNHYLQFIRATPWAKERFPLKIYIDQSPPNGYDAALVEQIKKALQCWLQVIDYGSCTYVVDPELSDLTIKPSKNSNPLTKTFGGQTSFRYTDCQPITIDHASIEIFSGATSIDGFADDAALQRFYSLVMHEFGHALGLDGHSPHADDLLYWKSAKIALSPRDIATIRLLYA